MDLNPDFICVIRGQTSVEAYVQTKNFAAGLPAFIVPLVCRRAATDTGAAEDVAGVAGEDLRGARKTRAGAGHGWHQSRLARYRKSPFRRQRRKTPATRFKHEALYGRCRTRSPVT